MAIKGFIKEKDAETREAPCGEDALALIDGGYRPDLVFLDLTMPGIGGVETLRELRERDPDLKVIVVTADVQGATLSRLEGLGPFEVIRKPATKHAVLAAYERAER